MTFHKYISFIAGMLYFIFPAHSQQDVINLSNPSFEDFSKCCKPPRGWFACGGEELGTPDVQPGWFNVDLPAMEGFTYIGMVTRDNDTWEAVSQRLERPLRRGECFTFSIKAAYENNLISASRKTGADVKYNKPIKIRIWGGTGWCHKMELLDETPLIDHEYWKQYNFRFEPKQNHTFITIEAFYKTPTLVPYNGNVIIDDASSILVVPCNQDVEPAVTEAPVTKEDTNLIVNIPPKKPDPTPPKLTKPSKPKPEPTEPVVDEIFKVKKKDLKEGQVLRIEKLYFQADSTRISQSSYAELNEIYQFLKSNEEVVIEIGGHTNNRCETTFCDELSKKRAQAVAYYLIGKGISSKRLKFKGYGKANPIATNRTPTGRKRNQRVEIKILSLDG